MAETDINKAIAEFEAKMKPVTPEMIETAAQWTPDESAALDRFVGN